MGIQQLQLRCAKCGGMTPHTQAKTNHILHLLLSLVTVGLWIIVWILIALSSGGARCEQCGTNRKAA